jgi:hypothetical protein
MTSKAGRTVRGGKWHALVIRPAMRPWPFDHDYPEMLYPACGSLAIGRYYFSKVASLIVEMRCGQTVVNCQKCLKKVGKAHG